MNVGQGRRLPEGLYRQPEWPFSEKAFPKAKRERYAGSDADERRLFYTAMTRARDMLYCSCFERKANRFSPSPYLLEVAGKDTIAVKSVLPVPDVAPSTVRREAPPLEMSFSDMASWDDCGYAYRLANVFGFQQWLAPELGYGKAVHHVLRSVAELVRETGKIPTREKVAGLLEREFYTPFAQPGMHDQMLKAAKRLVERYMDKYQDDLRRIWQVERPFELHTPDGLLTGRADVILDHEKGGTESLAIVDYKVSGDHDNADRHDLQLRIYTHAGRREGFDVRGAYLHSLARGEREEIDLEQAKVTTAVETASKAMASIRNGDFPPVSTKATCSRCDYARVCLHCERSAKAALL